MLLHIKIRQGRLFECQNAHVLRSDSTKQHLHSISAERAYLSPSSFPFIAHDPSCLWRHDSRYTAFTFFVNEWARVDKGGWPCWDGEDDATYSSPPFRAVASTADNDGEDITSYRVP